MVLLFGALPFPEKPVSVFIKTSMGPIGQQKETQRMKGHIGQARIHQR
jgi:hypothetical protein